MEGEEGEEEGKKCGGGKSPSIGKEVMLSIDRPALICYYTSYYSLDSWTL